MNLNQILQRASKIPGDNPSLKKLGMGATAVSIAMATIMAMEGVVYKTYRDPVGILTACYGHTGADVVAGKKYTPAECEALLQKDLVKHAKALNCVKDAPLTQTQKAAYVSMAYNIGVAGFCKSSTAKLANAGDMIGSCNAMMKHTKARKNGKLVELPGLVKRRKLEVEICKMELGEKK